MRRYITASYQREAEIIKKHSEKLRAEFLNSEHLTFAQRWNVSEQLYQHLVDEVLRMDDRTISKAMKRYSTTEMQKKKGPLEVKRQLLRRIQEYANGTVDIETGQITTSRVYYRR